jgi:hypothetical protein
MAAHTIGGVNVSFAQVLVVAIATAAGILVATLIVSNLVRAVTARAAHLAAARRVPKGREDEELVGPSALKPSLEVAGPERAELPETPVASYVPAERRSGVKQLRRTKAEPRAARGGEEATMSTGDDGGHSYARVGEEVTAVLSAAEHAAAQIRDAAVKEAEATRRAADETIAGKLAQAQTARAEADVYAERTCEAADRYAEVTRGRADKEAASKLAEAEKQARGMVTDAKKKAADLLEDAARRRDVLTEHTKEIEGRIESMLTSFGSVTAELEAMLSSRRSTATTADERPADETLDDALKRTAAEDLSRTYAEP